MNWKRYRFVLQLAKRDILDDRKISIVVVAMLSFSFLNLVFFPAFIQGLSRTFTSNIVETQTGHLTVQPEKGQRLENADAILRKVSNLEGVREVEKRLEFTSTATYRGETVTATTVGTSSLESEVYSSRIVMGSFLGKGDKERIVIGDILAQEDEQFGQESLGVKPGRTVEISFRNRTENLKLVGRIGRPGPGTVVRQMLIPYEKAEEILDAEGEATSIKILLDDREKADDFKKKLEGLSVQGEIKTWREVSDVAQSIGGTFSIVTAVVSLVGLVVAVTSIGVVIFINTNKRARETGIVRSIGAERGEILQVFVLESLIFGALGVLIGNAIMISIHTYLASNPLNTPIGVISTVLGPELLATRTAGMMVVALIAGFIPAYLVSQRGIIDTIEQR